VLTNNIIWNNSATIGQNEIQLNGGAPQITYSDVQGGWPGNGNIDLNPLMVDPNHNCFQLQPSSPCIDAGDPISPLDPDGTIVDMGAFYFDQFILNIDSLNISYEGNDIILHWDAVPQAVVYHIYRSDEPYFDITVMNPLASTTETSYIDEDALNEEKYYYRVTWE
jgi:hypothetical protein